AYPFDGKRLCMVVCAVPCSGATSESEERSRTAGWGGKSVMCSKTVKKLPKASISKISSNNTFYKKEKIINYEQYEYFYERFSSTWLHF
ncbi:hypothetical protein, partial [Methanocalculus sp.]|uniref:hypothetical protein n=1 Tax=Methanocalculus sp. TaxID=2004547 RepID=UPI002610298C